MFEVFAEARQAGQSGARDWCINNDVDYTDEDTNGE